MIVWSTYGSASHIPEGMSFITSRVHDWNTVMMSVRYFWCAVAKAGMMVNSTSCSLLGKSGAG